MIDQKRWILRILVLANVHAAIASINLTDSSEIDQSNEMDSFTTTKRTFLDRCLVKTEPGPCKQYVSRWTFIKTEGKCKTFSYGGCLGNENRFNSEAECLYYCGGGPERKENQINFPTRSIFIIELIYKEISRENDEKLRDIRSPCFLFDFHRTTTRYLY